MRIEYKTGIQRIVRDTIARRLIRVGIAREVRVSGSNTYQTRQMRAAEHQGAVVPDADQRAVLMADLTGRGIAFDESMGTDELRALTITNGDGLDAMDVDQLRILAKDAGMKIPARAGADKIRAALRAAQ